MENLFPAALLLSLISIGRAEAVVMYQYDSTCVRNCGAELGLNDGLRGGFE